MLILWIPIIVVVGFFIIRNIIDENNYEDSGYKDQTGKGYKDIADDKGFNGERLIFEALESLPGFGRVVVNAYIPKENATTEIDLIYIHRTGIYVIESKNYSGTIHGGENDREWTQVLEDNRKFKFYNPIMQNETHMKYLKKLLSNMDEKYFTSIIVFSKRCFLKVKSESIKVINRDDLNKLMNRYIKERGNVLEIIEIENIYKELKKYSDVDESIKANHIKNIKKKR